MESVCDLQRILISLFGAPIILFHGANARTTSMSVTVSNDDVDLTNLNWVSGAPVPLPANFSVSPPEHKSPTIRGRASPYSPFRNCVPSTTNSPATPSSRPVEIVVASPWRKKSTPTHSSSEVRLHNNSTDQGDGNDYKKPTCSYTCLIGMALRASPGTDGCLPVNEIYKYIE